MARSIIPENIINRFVLDSTAGMVTTVGHALRDYANSRTSKQLVAFVEEISTGPSQGAALEAHKQLAEAMAQSTRRSWGQAKRKLRPAIYDPIRTSRYHGGMDRALNSDELVVATAQGVQFGNIAVLDRDAAQWARLNAGALPRGQGVHESFQVRFSNLPAIEYVFDQPARPGYGLPVGGFKGPDGRWQTGNSGRDGAFYPKSGAKQEFPTRGNVGYDYLGAGIRRYFELLPRVYGQLFRDVLPASRRVGRPPIIAETKRTT